MQSLQLGFTKSLTLVGICIHQDFVNNVIVRLQFYKQFILDIYIFAVNKIILENNHLNIASSMYE